MILSNLIKLADLHFTDVQSTDTKALAIYKKLRENAFTHDNSFVADSPKVLNKLLESDIEVRSILATKEYYEKYKKLLLTKSIPIFYLASKEFMEVIVGHKIHHNAMMHGIRPQESALEELDDCIVMLDEITSTQNIGSIARSAAALGVGSLLVPKQGPHPYARRALRVSMGYVSQLKIHTYKNIIQTIKELQADGYCVYAAEVIPEAQMLQEVVVLKKWVLLLGHEGKGIAKEILDVCDAVVSIEMQEGVVKASMLRLQLL